MQRHEPHTTHRLFPCAERKKGAPGEESAFCLGGGPLRRVAGLGWRRYFTEAVLDAASAVPSTLRRATDISEGKAR